MPSHPDLIAAGAGSGVQFPEQGYGRVSARPEKVLLICYYDPAGVSTVPETVAFMQLASNFSVTVLNMHEHRVDMGNLQLHPWLRLEGFAAVVIHNTVSYNVDNLRSLDSGLQTKLRDFRGVKILMKQDENYRYRELAQYIGETGFDVVFTCLPPEAVPLVYPPQVVGQPRFERMLTGYVTPTLRARQPATGERPIDIGYRGSIQPLTFGWLAYEKRKIGDDVARLLAGSGLALDISSRWEDRLGGDAWFDFLSSSKATLGAESGASIFDLKGDLEERCAALEKEHASLSSDRERAEAVLAGLADLEDNVHYHQVSPRHFEAAACGAVQLLFPGDYSGLLVAGRHYFQLERDYSNLDEAVAFIRDEDRRREMAMRAYREVVLDRRNWIEAFVERVDACLAQCMQAKGLCAEPSLLGDAGLNVLLIAAHDPVIDPRLGWVEEGARGPVRVHQLGVLPPEATKSRVERTARGNLVMAHPRQSHTRSDFSHWMPLVADSPAGAAGMQELLFIERALALPEAEFCLLFGAPPGAARNAQFRWYLQYLLDTSATLLSNASAMRGIHALIATDLDTMPAALVLKGYFGIPVFYDAHEYWPEADPSSFEYERQFWIALERRMTAHADHRQTVSPGLADLMSRQYGVPFETVPNCEPVDRLLPQRLREPRADGSCHFLFQGNFAVGRGIDLLIKAWPGTSSRAILQLRGPDNPYKQEMIALAAQTGLLDHRIFFPAAVREGEMIAASAEADVGVVPYARTGTTYRHCCPNKMSQYMAAGLPILANATEFVSTVVRSAGCGRVVDFARQDLLVEAVEGFCQEAAQRLDWGLAGRNYFQASFNWNVMGGRFYDRLEERLQGNEPASLQIFETVDAAHRAPSPLVDPQAGAPAHSSKVEFQTLRSVWRRLPAPVRGVLSPVARAVAGRART